MYIYAHTSLHGQTERVGINRSVVRHRVVAGRQANVCVHRKICIRVRIRTYARVGALAVDVDIGRTPARLGNVLILIET